MNVPNPKNTESPVGESGATARVLLVTDTHIGFDLPARPRIERRRRGHDFLVNFERALEPAMHGLVDIVVHGGDLFFRSKVGAGLVEQAMRPLIEVARLEACPFSSFRVTTNARAYRYTFGPRTLSSTSSTAQEPSPARSPATRWRCRAFRSSEMFGNGSR